MHNGEILLIKREETELIEIILDSTTESQISKRKLAASEKTIVSIANEEGVSHNSVACSLKLAKNKLKKYSSKAQDEHTNRLKNLYMYYLRRYISKRKTKE